MIITVVCDVFGEENNGTVIAEMNLIRFLQKQGHIVRILCGDQSKKGKENFYVCPNLNLGKPLNNYVKKVGVSLTRPDKKIIRAALDGAEVVHLMIPLALSMKAVKIARKMNIPITAGFHMQAENLTSHILFDRSWLVNHIVYKYIYRHMYRYCDAIHFPTEFIKGVFYNHIKKPMPAYVISNGVHEYVSPRTVEKPLEYKDKYVILTTGRYSTEKRQDVLIRAVKYSKHKNDIQLILGGEGPKINYYKRLSKKLPNAPVFKFFSRNDIIDVLNYADMYVHPAQFELEGISCIEAITCGKLTVVSDSKLSATQNFAVDEKCKFRKNNAKDLARVIDYWIEHPKESKECAQKYLKSAGSFNQEECMKKMEQMIFDVIEKKKAAK